MALQLTNEEQELLKKENESLREDVNELKSLSKITNKVQSVMLDEMEDLKINDISFYPNPSDGRFTVDIKTGNENLVQIKIIGPDGAVVYEKSDQQSSGEYSFKVDLSQKRKGIYLLQVIQNNSSLTKRIIIE